MAEAAAVAAAAAAAVPPGVGEDPAIRSAAARIMALGPLAMGQGTAEEEPAAETGTGERTDPTRRQGTTDLAEAEAAEKARQAEAEGNTEETKSTDETSDDKTKAAESGGEIDYVEIPSEEDGKEAERVPLADLIASHKQVRALEGEIAAVVNKREAEYQKEQDSIVNELVQMHSVVRERAEAALAMMPKPQRPSRELLNPNSQYYNPEAYLVQEANYEDQIAVLRDIVAKRDEATKLEKATKDIAQQQQDAREHERLSRLKGWEDWKDPAKREARSTEMMTSLEKHYGIPRDLMDKYPFHHGIMQMAADALAHRKAPATAVAVKTQVQEKAPKIVKGQATPSRTPDGRFVTDAMKELSETGSRESAAKAIMRMGLARPGPR